MVKASKNMDGELLKTMISQAPTIAALLYLVYRQDVRLSQREARVDHLIERLIDCYQFMRSADEANASEKEATIE